MLRQYTQTTHRATQKVLVLSIKAYRVFFSSFLGGQCRFYPSCSYYVEEAIMTHGAIKGCWLGVWRLLRCNPLHRGGVDLVPMKSESKRLRKSGN